jgi:hypothetical protein
MSLFEDNIDDAGIFGITTKVDKDIADYIDKNKITPITVQAKNYFVECIKTIICENILFILFVLALIIFLTYRYYMKRQREKKEHFGKNDYDNEDIEDTYNILQFQNRRFVRPTMNPVYPIKKQYNYAVYPPDKMPHKVDGKNVSFVRDYNQEHGQKVYNSRDLRETSVPEQVFKKTYPNYGKNQSAGDCYAGTANTYSKKMPQPHYKNWLDYPTNFNETTGDFVRGSTSMNDHTLKTYYDILQNRESTLKNNLNMV